MGQVGLLSEVVQVEEGGASLNLSLNDGGRGHLEVAPAEVVLAEGVHQGGAHLEHLGRVLSSEHDVAVVQLDIGMRLFVQDGVGASGRGTANQLPVVGRQLVSSRGRLACTKKK